MGASLDGQAAAGPVLELRRVSKHYGGVAACSDVSMLVSSGEVVALVGHNGAGKSTIMRIVSGVVEPDRGEILISGRRVHLASVHDAREHGIETVPQELALAPKLNVAANVYLGREVTLGPRWFHVLARKRMEAGARKHLEALGIRVPNMKTGVGALSGGQRQGVAIARALGWGRSIVLLDEPTAALGVHETELVEQSIRRMRDIGLGVVLVSHDMEQVFRMADRIYVLYHGHIVGTMRPEKSTRDEVVGLITGTRIMALAKTGTCPEEGGDSVHQEG